MLLKQPQMPFRFYYALLLGATFAWAQPKLDLVPFGTLSQSVGTATVEWRDERDVHELRVKFGGTPPADLEVQYWHKFWPDTPPHMPTIEDHVDDPWQGQWLTAAISASCNGSDCEYTFRPLAESENPNARNLPGVRYRRTLKVRLISAGALPPLEHLSVYSDSVEKIIHIRIVLDRQARCEVSNGRLLDARPLPGPEKGLLVAAVAAQPSLPGSLDSTLITVRSDSGAFTFNVDDLARGPILIPDFHATITNDNEQFAPPKGKGPHIRAEIPKQPEQGFERASREVPPPDPWQDQYGRRIYMPLAPDSSWQKFAFEYGGNIFIRKSGTKAMGKELTRLQWTGDQITYRIGTGPNADNREDRKAQVEFEDGYLPVVRQHWTTDGIAYTEEAFATLLRDPLSPDDPARDEQTPAVLMVKITAGNPSAAPATGHVWLGIDPNENLRIEGHGIWGTRLRAVFDGADPTLETSGAHFALPLRARSRRSILLKIPFVSDTEPQDLEKLDYRAQRTAILDYWRPIVNASARFSVPDPMLNRMLRSVIWHIHMSTTKDPASGLYMVPAASYHYKVYANEACFQVLLLDALGDHRTAAQYLETFLQLQGSKNFPGLHHGLEDAIFHGARVNSDYDYTASTYGLDHCTVLWTLGEHYLYSRDREWLLHAWPHMEKAIAWVLKQRGNGLLPPSSLEDNSDWAAWFSINSFAWAGLDRAAQALADIGHPEAARIRREADRYRDDLRAAILRATEEAPIVQLRDGTYAPSVPVEPNQRFKRFGPKRIEYLTRYGTNDKPMLRLSATREVLYGPIIYLNLGLFDPNEQLANWVLDEWEDNITLTSGLGINVHGFTDDRYWFSQGGMVFQANLQNPILVYLKRHEIPAAIRGIYNNLAACLYPEANAFTEEYRQWGHASGPFYKIPDEAKFVHRVRDMLVLEDHDALYLAAGVPRRWLKSREGIHVNGMTTVFGPVTYELHAGKEPGTIEASIELPGRTASAWLVARVPSGRISSVMMNGRPWTRIDHEKEAIELPRDSRKLEVRIRYQ
jgi:hypothetical protein